MPAPAYQPITSAVTPAERRFLDTAAPLGVDWLATRNEYRERYGVSSYFGWREVIALPPSSAFSESPLTFVMYADNDVLDLAPEYLWADYMAHDDARQNHQDIELQLASHFGEPTIEDTSNCLCRSWSFGVFQVKLHTFPPELQNPAFTRPGSNPLLDNNPRLRLASSVSLHSEYAHPYPDATLSSLVTCLLTPTTSQGRTLLLACSSVQGRPTRFPLRRYTRRNPADLVSTVAESALIAWRDDLNQRIGVSAQRESVVVGSANASGLVLTHLKPGRGPGGFSVTLELSITAAQPKRAQSIGILDASASLERAANQLSEIWQLPLRLEEGYDE